MNTSTARKSKECEKVAGNCRDIDTHNQQGASGKWDKTG